LFPDFKKSFSNYCRTKILMELSVKRQFSALFANQSRATRVLSPSAPNSPSQSPLLLPMSAKKLAPLEPLPKGKYVPPRAPEVRHMLLQRTLKLSHGERVRLFAEIQVGAFRRLRSHAIFPFKIPAPGLYF
jgi:hypothetical protein